ncbi:MAG: hypothetical protein WA063_05225, partial [Minisyncoccia bacterium]
QPELLPASLLSVFGVGLQTYPLGEKEITPTLKEAIRKHDELKFDNAEKIKQAADQIQKLSNIEARKKYLELKRTDPKLAEKVKDQIDEDKLNLTPTDRLVKQLGVENGERAIYIWNELKTKQGAEKKEYIKDLIEKKIVSDKVYEQLQKIYKKVNNK